MANIKLLDLLLETLNDARTNYLDTNKISNGDFNEFNTIDTTANKAYIEKMCEFYVKYEISKEDIINMFTRVIDSKEENPTKHKELKNDIFNTIKSKKDFDNFKDKVLDFKFKIPNIQQYKNSENAELVYEDSRFVIFRVLNFKGACEIGSGTKWCHADKRKNSYDEYKDKANYMFFDNSYPKNNPKSGFALSVDKDGDIIELKSKDQKYKGEEHIDYPISYLTDNLGLDLKLFKYTKPSILSFINEFRDGLTLDIIKDKFSWLLEEDVNIEEVILGYKDDKLIWYDGEWHSGTWVNGIWNGGHFLKNGIWKDGIFERGYFNGKWYGGEWKGLKFEGEWLDPKRRKPLNIKEYKDGLTMDIIKDKFSWLLDVDVHIEDAILGYKDNKLIWYDGDWIQGTWENGIFEDGYFHGNGTWKFGIFEGGIFKGTWLNGTFKFGNFFGLWKNGDFEDGLFETNKIWENGNFKGGDFYGIWEGGIFEDGWFYGKWYGGEWKGGDFRGQWLDPNNPNPKKTKRKRKGFSVSTST